MGRAKRDRLHFEEERKKWLEEKTKLVKDLERQKLEILHLKADVDKYQTILIQLKEDKERDNCRWERLLAVSGDLEKFKALYEQSQTELSYMKGLKQ